jgi:hypothetical protein
MKLADVFIEVPQTPAPAWFKENPVQFIMLHTTASWHCKDYKHINEKFFLDYFLKTLRWQKVGYKFMIFCDHISQFGPLLLEQNRLTWQEVTYGEPKVNDRAVHISWIGGLEGTPRKYIETDNRTEYQKEAMWSLVKRLLEYYPNAKVCGHYQFSNKPCPLFNVVEEARQYDIPEKNIFDKDPYNYHYIFAQMKNKRKDNLV